MERPLVSVVTITRNRGELLKRCITSVLSQTYTNIEHIVVDGASDDITDEVIASFDDERLRFEKLDYNWPLKPTMDHAIDLCRGKYITFLDSDDEYLPSKVEKQVKLIESLPDDYGFVYCWMTYFDSSIDNEAYRLHAPQLKGSVGELVVEKPIISGTPTLLFRSSVLREMNGWKSMEEIGIVSDWELCARTCQKYKVDYVPESLVNVYVNHGSVRQSDDKYYKNLYQRTVKFHNYFLCQYSAIFNKKPKLAAYHYISMFIVSYKCHYLIPAVVYLFKALVSDSKYTFNDLYRRFKNQR